MSPDVVVGAGAVPRVSITSSKHVILMMCSYRKKARMSPDVGFGAGAAPHVSEAELAARLADIIETQVRSNRM
jgi:hypothetical protein